MPAYSLRPAVADDFEFLFEAHRITYRGYVEQTWGPWDEAWQREHFPSQMAPPSQVVVVDGQDAGLARIIRESDAFVAEFALEEGGVSLYIELIELLPRFQGQGVGTAIVRDAFAGAAARGIPVTLSVLRVNNRARALYQRLGFAETSENAERHFMRWMPGTGAG